MTSIRIRAALIAFGVGGLIGTIGYVAAKRGGPEFLVVPLWPGIFAWILSGGVHASPFRDTIAEFSAIAGGLFWAAVIYAALVWLGKWRARGRGEIFKAGP